MKRIYQFSFAMMLLVALLISFYYYFTTTKSSATSPSLEEYGNTIIENMQATTFDENGQLSNIIVTPKLVHDQINNTSYLEEPRVTLFREDAQPWEIQSVHGSTEEGAKKITLWDNVIIHQAPSPNNVETTIMTSKIIHYPDDNIAETDQFITMEQPGIFIESIGMRADLEKEIVNLLSNTRGRYEKNN